MSTVNGHSATHDGNCLYIGCFFVSRSLSNKISKWVFHILHHICTKTGVKSSDNKIYEVSFMAKKKKKKKSKILDFRFSYFCYNLITSIVQNTCKHRKMLQSIETTPFWSPKIAVANFTGCFCKPLRTFVMTDLLRTLAITDFVTDVGHDGIWFKYGTRNVFDWTILDKFML